MSNPARRAKDSREVAEVRSLYAKSPQMPEVLVGPILSFWIVNPRPTLLFVSGLCTLNNCVEGAPSRPTHCSRHVPEIVSASRAPAYAGLMIKGFHMYIVRKGCC